MAALDSFIFAAVTVKKYCILDSYAGGIHA